MCDLALVYGPGCLRGNGERDGGALPGVGGFDRIDFTYGGGL